MPPQSADLAAQRGSAASAAAAPSTPDPEQVRRELASARVLKIVALAVMGGAAAGALAVETLAIRVLLGLLAGGLLIWAIATRRELVGVLLGKPEHIRAELTSAREQAAIERLVTFLDALSPGWTPHDDTERIRLWMARHDFAALRAAPAATDLLLGAWKGGSLQPDVYVQYADILAERGTPECIDELGKAAADVKHLFEPSPLRADQNLPGAAGAPGSLGWSGLPALAALRARGHDAEPVRAALAIQATGILRGAVPAWIASVPAPEFAMCVPQSYVIPGLDAGATAAPSQYALAPEQARALIAEQLDDLRVHPPEERAWVLYEARVAFHRAVLALVSMRYEERERAVGFPRVQRTVRVESPEARDAWRACLSVIEDEIASRADSLAGPARPAVEWSALAPRDALRHRLVSELLPAQWPTLRATIRWSPELRAVLVGKSPFRADWSLLEPVPAHLGQLRDTVAAGLLRGGPLPERLAPLQQLAGSITGVRLLAWLPAEAVVVTDSRLTALQGSDIIYLALDGAGRSLLLGIAERRDGLLGHGPAPWCPPVEEEAESMKTIAALLEAAGTPAASSAACDLVKALRAKAFKPD